MTVYARIIWICFTTALLGLLTVHSGVQGQQQPRVLPPTLPRDTGPAPVFVASPKPAALDLPNTKGPVVTAEARSPEVKEATPALPAIPSQTPMSVPVAESKSPDVAMPQPMPTEPVAAPKTNDPSATPKTTEPAPPRNPLYDSVHSREGYGIHSLFDSLHPAESKGKHWYDKFSIRGYTQVRFGRSLYENEALADPFVTTDRSITGNQEGFFVRRARFIFSGEVSDYLALYAQIDCANTLPSTTTAFFSQMRDLYGDVYLDKGKEHRFRIGLSKVPFGFDNLQSSQNRVPLDRSDAINSVVNFNERDLGVFYYWTPKEKQKLFKDLVDGGLKGSGNYGILAFGAYNGQGLSQIEQNMNLHMVARLTYPFELPSGQVVEASVQGYTGDFVVTGSAIRPRGTGAAITPTGTGGTKGLLDQRVGGTFVWYPQPFGIQAEWNVGEGPALNSAQTAVGVRSLRGGYLMAMYKCDTEEFGIFTPYVRWQYFEGGYKAFANAPYGRHQEWNLGVEWQIRKEMELVLEYSQVDGPNLNAINTAGVTSYRNFDGGIIRAQFQINY